VPRQRFVVPRFSGATPCAVLLALLLAGCSRDSGAESGSHKVVLVPIGPVPMEVLTQLRTDLPAIIRRDVVMGAEIPLPAASFQPSRKQHLGQALLDELKRHDVPDADRVVGLIDADVYAPGLNFIFGQAESPFAGGPKMFKSSATAR
jgi:hypothetical protein